MDKNPHIRLVQDFEKQISQSIEPSLIIYIPVKYHQSKPQLVKAINDSLVSYKNSLRVSSSDVAKKMHI